MRFPTIILVVALSTFGQAANNFKAGNYTGDGTASHAITGVGFQPSLVIVKATTGSTAGMFKTSSHSTTVSSFTDASADNAATGILSLDSDGFTVGSVANANTNAVVYQYMAMADNNTVFKTGTYTGNGTTQNPSLGWQPTFVMVKGTGATNAAWKTASQGGTISSLFGAASDLASTGVTALNATTFTVSSDASVNTNGTTYYYVAWNYGTASFDTASYTGDGTDPRTITMPTGTFTPDWVMVKDFGSNTGAWTDSNISAPTSFFWTAANTGTTQIESRAAGSFNVGSSVQSNTSARTYHWFALKTTTQVSTGKCAACDLSKSGEAGSYLVTFTTNPECFMWVTFN